LRGQAGMSYDPEELIEATKQLIAIEPIARIQVLTQLFFSCIWVDVALTIACTQV
jgi:hypothetical protein